MKLPLYQVDAFTNRLFGGNHAAVVLLCPTGQPGWERPGSKPDRSPRASAISDASCGGIVF
jgi:hypothetical protein